MNITRRVPSKLWLGLGLIHVRISQEQFSLIHVCVYVLYLRTFQMDTGQYVSSENHTKFLHCYGYRLHHYTIHT